MKIKVGVIYGGETVEHEVSIISAIQAINKLDQEKYEIIPIYITKDRQWYTGDMLKDIEIYSDFNLIKKYGKNVVLYEKDGSFVLQNKKFPKSIVTDIDIVFPIMHGTNGEDGVIQGYLQSIGIPFVGGDIYASVVGQDKAFMKAIFEKENLPMTKYVWFYDYEYKNDSEEVLKNVKKLKYPVIIKPATTGSSVGIKVAENDKELVEAIDNAISYDNKILVEEVVANLKEVNISVLGNYEHQRLSVIEEVMSKNKFLTYDDKYIGGGKGKLKGGMKVPMKGASKGMASADRKIPADILDKQKKEIEDRGYTVYDSERLDQSIVFKIEEVLEKDEIVLYKKNLMQLEGQLSKFKNEDYYQAERNRLEQIIKLKSPSRALLASLIDKIYITENKKVEIYFKFKNISLKV